LCFCENFIDTKTRSCPHLGRLKLILFFKNAENFEQPVRGKKATGLGHEMMGH
jgi:hypothetical protein